MCIDKVNEPLTKELIIKTHRILMEDFVQDGTVVDTGRWRTTIVAAGTHDFPPPSVIGPSMNQLLDECTTRIQDSSMEYNFIKIKS